MKDWNEKPLVSLESGVQGVSNMNDKTHDETAQKGGACFLECLTQDIDFSIVTVDEAWAFLCRLSGLTRKELVFELCECDGDFMLFWERNECRFNSIDPDRLRFHAFHILGSIDDCSSIVENGLLNLHQMLGNKTALSEGLKKCGVTFDLNNGKMLIDDYLFDVGPDSISESGPIGVISARISRDYCVNGFLCNEHPEGYGTGIHKRPEFLLKLSELSPKVKKLSSCWASMSTPYAVHYYARLEQLPRYQFGLDGVKSGCSEGGDYPAVLKWAIQQAIDRVTLSDGAIGERIMYLLDDESIPTSQIMAIKRLHI